MIPLWQALGACVLTGAAGYGLRAGIGTWRERRAADRAVAWWHTLPRPVGVDVLAPLYGRPNVTQADADWRARVRNRLEEMSR